MEEAIDPGSEPGLVFIHGAGLDVWIWDELSGRLEGNQLPVAFPGRGTDPSTLKAASLQAYVDHVRRQIETWPVEQVVLVAHSIGGVVGLEVAHRLPDSVTGFVGVCAAIPDAGGSFLSCFPLHQRLVQLALLRLLGTKPPDSTIRTSLCDGLSGADTDRIVEGFVPESRRLFTDRTTGGAPDLPSLYVQTTADSEFSPSVQERMIANLRPDEVRTVPAGHMPMRSHPAELATIVADFVETYSNSPP